MDQLRLPDSPGAADDEQKRRSSHQEKNQSTQHGKSHGRALQHPRLRSSACFARWENVDHLDSGLPFEIGKQVNRNHRARRNYIIDFGLILRKTIARITSEVRHQIHPFFLALYHPAGINRNVGPMHASASLVIGTSHLKGGGVIGLSLHAFDGICALRKATEPNSRQHRKAKPKTAMARLKSMTLIGWEDSGRANGLPVGDALRTASEAKNSAKERDQSEEQDRRPREVKGEHCASHEGNLCQPRQPGPKEVRPEEFPAALRAREIGKAIAFKSAGWALVRGGHGPITSW